MGNTSDPTSGVQVVLQTVVWAMVSRQVTIVGSGMRRIDDRGRHGRRDVGRHNQIDDAQTFKATKKSSASCLVGEDSVAMASSLGVAHLNGAGLLWTQSIARLRE